MSVKQCPKCKGKEIKQAYRCGYYFVRCETCGEHATFISALAMIVSAWCGW